MAYADTIRTTSCDMGTVATLLDGLVVSYTQYVGSSTFSTSSTSVVDITGATITTPTIRTGERVLIYGAIHASNSSQYQALSFRVRDGSNSVRIQQTHREPIGRTGGDSFVVRGSLIDFPAAGSPMTYKLSCLVGGGTMYTTRQVLWAIVFRKT